ncbi:beta-ketoacyl reductase [Streptomyces sp. HUAS TT20]|uniref:beta-ketoacyl reductase n=1 Tax=Streptomyces sp. HUAS TT20 TaxID=3447509 RepID=UPI0021D8C478|nr:beta-ketoacyl reductase [Streptomyces sp. HUAS 15-9]UXY32780.1 beta-ketoacyl reductase [Streptomyces sp. HUAS 15-9]
MVARGDRRAGRHGRRDRRRRGRRPCGARRGARRPGLARARPARSGVAARPGRDAGARSTRAGTRGRPDPGAGAGAGRHRRERAAVAPHPRRRRHRPGRPGHPPGAGARLGTGPGGGPGASGALGWTRRRPRSARRGRGRPAGRRPEQPGPRGPDRAAARRPPRPAAGTGAVRRLRAPGVPARGDRSRHRRHGRPRRPAGARLARRGAEHLVLASRRGPAAPGAADLEAELTGLGARVTLAACDAADRDALAALLGGLEADGDPVRAVFHVAGDVSLVKPLADTTTAELAQVVAGKDAGALHLHDLLRRPLDAFVLFSSITGVWGSGRQCAYSAANAYLDALAEHRRGLGLTATSMQWGPWAGRAHDEHEHELARRGLRLMEAGPALVALDRALGRDETTTVVADMDWSLFAPAYAAARPRPLFDDLPEAQRALRPGGLAPAAGESRTGELRRALLAVEPGRRRRGVLVDRCRREVGRVLRLDPARVDATVPFTSMGLDSLMALEVRKGLEAAVEVALPATLAWRYPTIDALAPFLAERMGIPLDAAAADGPPAAPPEAAEPALDVEALSDDDVEALLLQRLESLEGGRHDAVEERA